MLEQTAKVDLTKMLLQRGNIFHFFIIRISGKISQGQG